MKMFRLAFALTLIFAVIAEEETDIEGFLEGLSEETKEKHEYPIYVVRLTQDFLDEMKSNYDSLKGTCGDEVDKDIAVQTYELDCNIEIIKEVPKTDDQIFLFALAKYLADEKESIAKECRLSPWEDTKPAVKGFPDEALPELAADVKAAADCLAKPAPLPQRRECFDLAEAATAFDGEDDWADPSEAALRARFKNCAFGAAIHGSGWYD